jgi:hypothetical protein
MFPATALFGGLESCDGSFERSFCLGKGKEGKLLGHSSTKVGC